MVDKDVDKDIAEKVLEVSNLFKIGEGKEKGPYETKQEVLYSLDSTRVYIIDTLFDLEATNRENVYLKKLLKEQGG